MIIVQFKSTTGYKNKTVVKMTTLGVDNAKTILNLVRL